MLMLGIQTLKNGMILLEDFSQRQIENYTSKQDQQVTTPAPIIQLLLHHIEKPEMTVSTSSINLTGCSGSSGNSGSFDISGNYIKNSDELQLDAPTNFEISQDNSSFQVA